MLDAKHLNSHKHTGRKIYLPPHFGNDLTGELQPLLLPLLPDERVPLLLLEGLLLRSTDLVGVEDDPLWNNLGLLVELSVL